MDFETIDTSLNLSEVAGIFREVVKRRPLAAKASRVDLYTPDVGPWKGMGGID